jgi:hypothetical protein
VDAASLLLDNWAGKILYRQKEKENAKSAINANIAMDEASRIY